MKPIVYVKKNDFYQNFQEMMREIEKYNSEVRFIGIGIAKSDIYNKKSFGFNQNIFEYNQIISDIFKDNYLNIDKAVDKYGLIADNLHLSKKSHNELFKLLKSRIEVLKKCVE